MRYLATSTQGGDHVTSFGVAVNWWYLVIGFAALLLVVGGIGVWRLFKRHRTPTDATS
jgi:hypothetical protein